MNENNDEIKREKVRVIPLRYIDDFPNHPFLVKDDESMVQLVKSIEMNGVLNSRLDITKIPEILSERIEKVILHIPSFYGTADNIDVFVPEKRFCSFGSTWNKKINYSERACSSIINGRYLTIDATNIFTNKSGHELVYNEGFIIKPQKEKKDFLAISTGDSYFAPQILEIKLKN